jgi:two-component system NtrC family sensor kinase
VASRVASRCFAQGTTDRLDRRPRLTADKDVCVFWLRTIRRKLLLSLLLIMGMLVAQAVGGLSGLLSYRNVIQELDHTVTAAPKRSSIVLALSAVFEPLLWPPLKNPDWLLHRQRAIRERCMAVSEALRDYHRRLENEAASADVRIPTEAVLHRIDSELAQLMAEQLPRVADPDVSEEAIAEICRGIAALQLAAVQIPRPERGVDIEAARAVYHSRFWWIVITSALAVGLFLSSIRCGYLWIFIPIQKLYQGASRVAQGDFSYRVHLPGHDEMAQLADKLNSMTARFQEIKDRLDREVESRSKQLLRSERLAGVGFLAAGVAHEINNPLSAIAMAAESLDERLQAADEQPNGLSREDLAVLKQYLNMMQREAFRCQQITRKLLDFSRGQDEPHSPHDLTRIVAEVLDLVGHMSKFRGHEIVFDRSKPVWWTVNGAEIKQVVLNLVANALESMDGVGRLEIQIVEHADEVVLTFRDTGCGMTTNVLENLFEPFFTAKKSGRGTGLGLSISHRIVSDHGGRIEALSDGPGTGSTFHVHLPRRTVAAQAA